MPGPRVLIVTPYAAAANNGNWRTAARWSRLLRPQYRVIVRTADETLPDAEALIALHARRSHDALAAWRAAHPGRPAAVVLTGTDLYGDLPAGDAQALGSLRLADRLVVLQAHGLEALPRRWRAKARIIHQSAPALAPARKAVRHLEAVFVGHVRPVKDAPTFLRAASRLALRPDMRFALIGGLREPGDADAMLAAPPNVRLAGALPHAATRQRIRRAHVLVVPSRMEGGANVIVEAVLAGTPVLASDCGGNVGMLGGAYAGYFPVGDDEALARLVARCRDEPRFYAKLARQCAARARLFAPDRERRALAALVRELFASALSGRRAQRRASVSRS